MHLEVDGLRPGEVEVVYPMKHAPKRMRDVDAADAIESFLNSVSVQGANALETEPLGAFYLGRRVDPATREIATD